MRGIVPLTLPPATTDIVIGMCHGYAYFDGNGASILTNHNTQVTTRASGKEVKERPRYAHFPRTNCY